MPGELCPLCGTVRTAVGCACASSSPDVTETAVLPHLEGPPLVRPYVAAGGGHSRPYAGPGPDPFATTLLPPAPPAAHPAAPPPPAAPPGVPPQRPDAASRPVAPPGAGGDLGVFDFHGTPQQRPGGRAERRERAQLVAGRRRTAVIAAGLGIAVVGAGLALALSPSSDKPNLDQALPAPSGTLDSAPPDGGLPEPTATASASTTQKSSASPTRVASRAGASRTAAPSPAGSAPASASAAPPAAPSTSAAARVLKPGDSGPDVRAMQQMLITVSCGDLNVWFATGTFDSWTQWILSEFQRDARIKGDERNGTQYGPKTRAALEKASADPNC